MAKKSPFDSSLRAIALSGGVADNEFPNMNEKEEPFKPSIHGASRDGKRERAFELSLPALVTGVDALENKFREKTVITSISSEEAIVWLRSQVPIGAKLDISLDIPKTLILESSLKLELTGTVLLCQTDSGRNGEKTTGLPALGQKIQAPPHPSERQLNGLSNQKPSRVRLYPIHPLVNLEIISYNPGFNLSAHPLTRRG